MLKSTYRSILLFLISPCRISLVWVPCVVCIGSFLLNVFLFYPGFVCPTGYAQFYQMEEGIIGDWHPPIMVVTWQFCRSVYYFMMGKECTGDGMLYVLWTSMIWTGMLLVLLSGKSFWKNQGRSQKSWMVVLSIVILLPWSLIDLFGFYLRYVAKDTGMIAAFLLAVGCLMIAPNKGWRRWLILGMALICIFYGTAIRHNTIFTIFPILCWLVWIVVPSKRLSIVFPCSLVLWAILLVAIHYMNYNLLGTLRLYPLQERFYADILHLNTRTKHFVMPPNTFGNDFTGIEEEAFRNNFEPYILYIEDATENLRKKFPEKLAYCPLTQDLVVIRANGENGVSKLFPAFQKKSKVELRILNEEFVRTQFPQDYLVLRNAWIKRILQNPVTYVKFKTAFFVKYCKNNSLYFLGLNPLLLLPLICFIAISPVFTQKNHFPSIMLAWSALFYLLPLWMFLPYECFRYLPWFFAASIFSIVMFCHESQWTRSFIEKTINHGKMLLMNTTHINIRE